MDQLWVDFYQGGNGHKFLGQGWSNPEPHEVWSNGEKSQLRLEILLNLRIPMIAATNSNLIAATIPI
jgi:hypothetical protein